MNEVRCELAVIGGGSGGIGAALAAARCGVNVVLVEKAETLGGNAAHCGVNVWEPGVGGTGLPFEIYLRLKTIPRAVGIYSFGRHICWSGTDAHPGGELLIDPQRGYLDSLRRHGAPGDFGERHWRSEHWHGVPFDPDAYERVVRDLLAETGRCTVKSGVGFRDVTRRDARRLSTIELDDGTRITARLFVDATADLHLAHEAGCRTQLGQEARAAYGEPGAPDEPTDRINGVSLLYRITRSGKSAPAVDALPEGIPAKCWWAPKFPVAACTQYPNGDFNINPLPVMEGREALRLGRDAAHVECRRRVLAHWHDIQVRFSEFRAYRIERIFPGLGVRETRRLVGRHVLTEHDLDAGLSGQTHDDIVCLADHSKDVHGEASRGSSHELAQPYGVPYRCLLPLEYDNLAVACRGASFSSIGASSCRLSRTMLQLGQATGTAASIALTRGDDFTAVSPALLRDRLRAQHVQLEWPMPAELRRYIEELDGRVRSPSR